LIGVTGEWPSIEGLQGRRTAQSFRLGQPCLRRAYEEGRAQGQRLVIELVSRAVHFAAAGGTAVAGVLVAAGHPLEHEGAILRSHDQWRIAV
jgi:hypothetical protein